MLKIMQTDSSFRLNYLDRNIRKLTISGIFTLFVALVLSVYLLPFGYMVATSVKNTKQITRNTILPLTQLTYTYEGASIPSYRVNSGDEFPIFAVPTEEGEQNLALVVASTTEDPNIFLDPITLNIVEWVGDTSTLPQADQVVLFRYREDDMPELGLVKSRDYPVYQLETETGEGQWALIRGSEHIFIDVNNPRAGIIKWNGDINSLEPAPAVARYKYNDESNPELGLVQLASYDVYEASEGDGQWALVRQADNTAGTSTVVIAFDPATEAVIEILEWDGDVNELQPVYQSQTFRFRGRGDGGIGLVRNTDYPLYEVPLADGAKALALVNVGNPNQFIEPNEDEIIVVEWEGDVAELTPVYQQAQNFIAAVDRSYGLRKDLQYPVYYVPTDDGEQSWALIRIGTQTGETIFLNPQNEEAVETISLTIDETELTPIEEPAVYSHFGSPVPDWSLQAGDDLLLYRSPDDIAKQWALVAGYTPASGKDSVFIDPDNPDEGIFLYSNGYYGSLKTVDKFDPQFSNFETAWNQISFLRLLFNTTAIAVIGLAGTLISCTIVAYGFARFPVPGKNILFMILIATIVLPRQVTLVPTFAFFSRIGDALGWYGMWLWAPLLLPHFFANAYNVFLLRQFIQTIPREMDEAAMIDGAGPFKILTAIIVPQAWPALVAAGLFHFVFAWNDYFEPLIYTLREQDIQPISVGIQQYNFQYDTQVEMIQATSIMALVLPILLFFLAQRYFMRGVVITGVDK